MRIHSPLWTRTHTPYPYEHLRNTEPTDWILKLTKSPHAPRYRWERRLPLNEYFIFIRHTNVKPEDKLWWTGGTTTLLNHPTSSLVLQGCRRWLLNLVNKYSCAMLLSRITECTIKNLQTVSFFSLIRLTFHVENIFVVQRVANNRVVKEKIWHSSKMKKRVKHDHTSWSWRKAEIEKIFSCFFLLAAPSTIL
jgi:hypothetical protein